MVSVYFLCSCLSILFDFSQPLRIYHQRTKTTHYMDQGHHTPQADCAIPLTPRNAKLAPGLSAYHSVLGASGIHHATWTHAFSTEQVRGVQTSSRPSSLSGWSLCCPTHLLSCFQPDSIIRHKRQKSWALCL